MSIIISPGKVKDVFCDADGLCGCASVIVAVDAGILAGRSVADFGCVGFIGAGDIAAAAVPDVVIRIDFAAIGIVAGAIAVAIGKALFAFIGALCFEALAHCIIFFFAAIVATVAVIGVGFRIDFAAIGIVAGAIAVAIAKAFSAFVDALAAFAFSKRIRSFFAFDIAAVAIPDITGGISFAAVEDVAVAVGEAFGATAAIGGTGVELSFAAVGPIVIAVCPAVVVICVLLAYVGALAVVDIALDIGFAGGCMGV